MTPNTGNFDRRQYLAAIGTVCSVGIAGCGSNSSGLLGGDTSTEADAEIVDSEVFTDPPSSDSVTWQRIDVKNPTQTLYRVVEVETEFQDSNGEPITTERSVTAVLPADTTWRSYSTHDFGIETFAQTEHTIVSQAIGTTGDMIEAYELRDTSLIYNPERNFVGITGEVELESSEISEITIVHQIYDAEGQFRGAFSVEKNISQQLITFSSGQPTYPTPADQPEPASFETIIVEPSL